MDIKSEKQVVVITGGSSGLGLETARLLLETGLYEVIIAGSDQGRLNLALESLNSPCCAAYVCDITDREQCENLISAVMQSHGIIDTLVNNAGALPPSETNLTTEEIYRYEKVNNTGHVWLTDAAMRSTSLRSVVFVGSVADRLAFTKDGGIYANSKWALRHYANEIASKYQSIKVGFLRACKMATPMAKKLEGNKIEVGKAAEYLYASIVRPEIFPLESQMHLIEMWDLHYKPDQYPVIIGEINKMLQEMGILRSRNV